MVFSFDPSLAISSGHFGAILGEPEQEKNKPDGVFVIKQGKTNYKVKVFFDHSSGLTAEDRLKRIIQAEAERESA